MKVVDVLRESVRSHSNDDLRYLHDLLSENRQDDRYRAGELLMRSRDMERLFNSTTSAFELYDYLDDVRDHVKREMLRRETANS